jgi:methionine-gamma-lyase
MLRLQEEKVGYLAVSLGYFKTLFSAPGHSTSAEIPEAERQQMGMGDGLIRFSVGLDNDIARTWKVVKQCLQEVGVGQGKGAESTMYAREADVQSAELVTV